MPAPSCATLWAKSCFSFLEGASRPSELVQQAHDLGHRAVALTDRDGVYGAVRAHLRAQELGYHLIIGAQLTVDDGSRVLLLAQDDGGYADLCLLISRGRLRSAKGECQVTWDEVCDAAPGLVALWGGGGSLLVEGGDRYRAPASRLLEAYGDRLYALAARHQVAAEAEQEERLRRRAARLGLPVVAAVEVLYHSPSRRPLQDVLECVRAGVNVHTAGRLLRPNAEHYLKSPRELAELFADDPAALAATCEVAERCTYSLDRLQYRYPSERLPHGITSAQWLRQLTIEGARWRYEGVVPDEVLHQVDRELELIEELDYPGYFLSMWEVVEFCRARQILCQGRGSAANSAVCYCLGITAVDPVKMDLLFERFLSKERPDPPDIDLDIEHERREEVIQHVYAKYGRSHAAMVANYVCYRSRSAIRDVGKALGLPETSLDRVAKLLGSHAVLGGVRERAETPGWPGARRAHAGGHVTDERHSQAGWSGPRSAPDSAAGSPNHGQLDLEETLEQAGLDPGNAMHRHLIDLAVQVQGYPRHLSIHPGGFLLGQQPVHHIVPIENATMEDRTVIQWDKDDVEALSLFKVDLLGLGALAMIHRCLDMLAEHKGLELTLATIPHEDTETYDMICRGDTVGVFQIESRAQMAMLPRLRPRTFYDIVIEVSIVRPGPIAGDMVHPYLRRRHGLEPVTYPHPCLKPVLAKTLGVPLFQEQVIKLAMVAADYTPGEADQLRRDMAAWKKSGRIQRHRQRLVSRMMRKGIKQRFAERVFDQIQGFGEYGFPESHAASFALIAYATAWLKRHHPDAFCCGLLNAQPMGFYTPATIVEDARRHEVEVRPVDVRVSHWDCTLEPKNGEDQDGEADQLAVRMGLRYIKGLAEAEGQRLALTNRAAPFADLADFVRRSALSERNLVALAEGGALEGLGMSRREALWEVRRLVRGQGDSLSVTPRLEVLPAFSELDPLETIAWDYRRTRHSTRGHPLGPLRPVLAAHGLPDATSVHKLKHGVRLRYAGLVIARQRPGTAKGVTFMTMEDETGFVNLVFWRDVFAKYSVVARTENFFGVTGELQKQDGVVHIIVEELWTPPMEREPVSQKSRDFH